MRVRDLADVADLPWDEAVVSRFEADDAPVLERALRCITASSLLDWCRSGGQSVRVLTNSEHHYTAPSWPQPGWLTRSVRSALATVWEWATRARDVFHHACSELGLPPDRVLYVGVERHSDAF